MKKEELFKAYAIMLAMVAFFTLLPLAIIMEG